MFLFVVPMPGDHRPLIMLMRQLVSVGCRSLLTLCMHHDEFEIHSGSRVMETHSDLKNILGNQGPSNAALFFQFVPL